VRNLNDKGIAMTFVIIIIIILAFLATLVTVLGYNQRKLSDSAGGRRAAIYYRAQAGVIEASWRIRENIGGSFTTDTYDPAPYSIDVDGDGTDDCDINIGPANAVTKQRSIVSTGRDV